MIKRLLSLCLLPLLALPVLPAQGLKFAFPSDGVIAVEPTGQDSTNEHKLNFYLTNTSGADIQASAFREENLAAGHQSYFCWDLCYDTTKDFSDGPVTIAAGDTTTFAQYIVFIPNQTNGYSEVTMIIANNATGDTIQRTYKFSVGGVLSTDDKLWQQASLSAPYPNPAGAEARVDYELPNGLSDARIRVYNLIGKMVYEQPLKAPQGTVTLQTAALQAGMYFIYLTADNRELTSRKLIVR